MKKNYEKSECKASETISSEDQNSILRPWLKPTFEREVMKEALSFGGTNGHFDGIYCGS
ncbi:MAG TPA: hypothetical protein VJ440_08500 [Candidatus Brocadiaceae bacterium]|nr:hypothetical protein [Candidatus Brocadiaceae bacterium]